MFSNEATDYDSYSFQQNNNSNRKSQFLSRTFPSDEVFKFDTFCAGAAGYLDVAMISRHGTVHRHYTASLCARNRRTKECDSRDDERKKEREQDER